MGASGVVGAHLPAYIRKMKVFKTFAPLAGLLGPELGPAALRTFKPRFFNRTLIQRALGGGLLGAAPAALAAALT